MIRRSHGLSIILVLAATLAGGEPASERNGALPTLGELLKRHNIELTQSALVQALTNADPEVRYLAALKLAEDKAGEAIPAIKDALASEKVPRTRINIAFALAEFGEPTGFDALEDNCRNHDAREGIAAQSAEYMLRFKRECATCLNALLDVLQTGSNGYRAQAASLLPYFHNLSAEDSERVFAGLLGALHASDAFVEMAAGRALADLGDIRAIPELREAATKEQEEAVRTQIEQDLAILQEKTRR
ncbi:MAG: HEAT repeat domain-containing protein [Candidatus Sulfotelmatobacter sp.]